MVWTKIYGRYICLLCSPQHIGQCGASVQERWLIEVDSFAWLYARAGSRDVFVGTRGRLAHSAMRYQCQYIQLLTRRCVDSIHNSPYICPHHHLHRRFKHQLSLLHQPRCPRERSDRCLYLQLQWMRLRYM
jgi:hypothetical protein